MCLSIHTITSQRPELCAGSLIAVRIEILYEYDTIIYELFLLEVSGMADHIAGNRLVRLSKSENARGIASDPSDNGNEQPATILIRALL